MRPDTGAPTGPATGSARELVERFPTLRPPSSSAGAAVMIVLRDGTLGVEALLIQRATNPEDPASGDVALPGGRVDDEDGSLERTAVRELREEVGLGLADLDGPPRFVGVSPARRFSVHVGIFAALLSASAPAPSVGSPEEVAAVFWLPRDALRESRLISREGEREGETFRFFGTEYDGHLVWGFTRRVLRDFFGFPVEENPASSPAPTLGESRLV